MPIDTNDMFLRAHAMTDGALAEPDVQLPHLSTMGM